MINPLFVGGISFGYNRENGGSDAEFFESGFPRKVAHGFYHIRNVNQVFIMSSRNVVHICLNFYESFHLSFPLFSSLTMLIITISVAYGWHPKAAGRVQTTTTKLSEGGPFGKRKGVEKRSQQ